MVPIFALTPQDLESWKKDHTQHTKWVEANRFFAKAGTTLLIPDHNGTLMCVLLGLGEGGDLWCAGVLSAVLPAQYQYNFEVEDPIALLAYELGTYRFTQYQKQPQASTVGPHVVFSKIASADKADVERLKESTFMVRDMVNMPANDMNPQTLQAWVEEVGHARGANVRTIMGDELLTHNLPLIHAVGKGSATPPRLIELTWGNDPAAPLITLVGKGVCFDSGGLDIKTPSGMLLMKKDMGGAACALGLARLIMDAELPWRVKLLIPAVENSISGNSYRPGDIIKARNGLCVEIGNTDAEGRLILADALCYASEDAPAYLIDFATLTGAARIALGPDLPAFFTPCEQLVSPIQTACSAVRDDVWRMPLWQPYVSWLKKGPADLNNICDNGYAGVIVAAIFLQQFVPSNLAWMHFDLYAWRPTATHWCPKGGEAYVIRGLYYWLKAQ